MEIHQLRYFVAVAEVGSFRQAAARCHVAQPSLSQQIKKLEKQLGHQLFDRLGRGIALTEAGQALLPRAKRILAEVREAERGLDDALEAGRGTVVVGAIPTIAPFLLPQVVQRFVTDYPEARIEIIEDLGDHLLDALSAAEIDLALLSTPIERKDIEVEELMVEPLWVTVPKGHPLSRAERVELEDLRDQPTVILDGVHCLGAHIQGFCQGAGFDHRPLCRANQLTTVQSMVGLGLGISLVPRMAALVDPGDERHYLPIADATPQRNIVAARRSGRHPSRLGTAFLAMVRQECEHEETGGPVG